VVSIFLGVVALAFTQSIFNLFFVPIIVGVLWNSTNRIGRLEKRLSQVQARLSVEQSATGKDQPSPSSSS
jgi:hypothetical protein